MKAGKDFIGVGCGAFIVNEKNEVLLMRRGAQSKNEVGSWSIPGGALDYGERFHEGVKREIMEELGVEIAIVDLLCLTDHILHKEGQHWVTPAYLATIVSGVPEIKEPTKCDALGWFALDQLPETMPAHTRNAADAFLRRQNK